MKPEEEEKAPESEEEVETPQTEIVVGEEEKAAEEKPEVVTMSPSEFASLKAQSDSAKAIKEGIEGLSSKLSYPQAQQTPAANSPQETPEEFFAKNADDMFDKDKGGKLLREYNKRVAQQEYGPIISGLSSSLATTRKELLESRDANFRKYKTEVEALVASQPPDVRIQPDIYERAWATVKTKHQAEIDEDTVSRKVDEALAAKLKELGIDPTKPAARPPVHVNSEGRSTPASGAGAARKVRLPDQATKEKLEREALRRGMNMDDLLRVKGYIE